MSSRWWVGLVLSVGMLATPVLAQDLRSNIDALNTEWNQTFNKGDAKALAELYTDDATLVPPAEQIVSGTAAIQAFWKSLIDAGVTDHQLESLEVEEAGDTAFTVGKWQAKGKDSQGQPATFRGHVVKVLERQGDRTWKTRLHTWNLIP